MSKMIFLKVWLECSEDTGKRIHFNIRRGIALVTEEDGEDGEVDVTVTTTETTWREIMSKVYIPIPYSNIIIKNKYCFKKFHKILSHKPNRYDYNQIL